MMMAFVMVMMMVMMVVMLVASVCSPQPFSLRLAEQSKSNLCEPQQSVRALPGPARPFFSPQRLFLMASNVAFASVKTSASSWKDPAAAAANLREGAEYEQVREQ